MHFLLVIILVLHLIVYMAVYQGYRKKIISIPINILLLAMLIPVWGCITALVSNHILHRRQDRKVLGSEEETAYRTSYKTIVSSINNNLESIVPLEEAMTMNDSNQRRSLMINILNQNPEKHVDLFLEVACAGDVETTHYAVTALSELQRDYEVKIQECQREYLKNDKDYNALKKYSNILYDYITSGLIDSEILNIQRKRLSKLLRMQRKVSPDDMDLFFRAVNNELALENYELVNELLDYMITKWEKNENVWIMKMNFLSKMKRENEIQDMLRQIEKREIYFSHKGKKVIDLCKQRNEKGHEYEKRSVL